MPRWSRMMLLSMIVPALSTASCLAVIKNLIPLRSVLSSEQFIFEAKVEKIDPERPAVFLSAGESLKGKVPFTRLPINMTGDSEAKREKHTEQILKRLAPELKVIVFVSKRGPRYLGFVYSNGTWFQMEGRGEKDDEIKWSFLHGEPYLRRTFRGTTAELKKAVADGLAGKAVPDPDEKAEPGFGPEANQGEKKDEPAKPPLAGSSVLGPPFAVAPTFLLIGPLALLATLFPTVFGGLAMFMRRWSVALSYCCTVSTIYFLHGWFARRLDETWFGKTPSLWLVMGILTAIGAFWSARRFRKAMENGEGDAFASTKWDRIILSALSVVGVAAVGFGVYRNGAMLRYPWLDVIAFFVPVWVGTVAIFAARTVAVETVFLWGLAAACGIVAALETGRQDAKPLPIRKIWEQGPPGDGPTYGVPLAAGDKVFVTAVQASGLSQSGMVFALDAKTGAILWHFNNDQDMKPVFCSPVLADGRLFIGEGFHENQDCRMFCIDANTGKKIWEFQTISHTESQPVVMNGRVYFGAGDDGVFCVDAEKGTRIWNYPAIHVDSRPVVANGRVYVGSGVGDKYNTTLLVCIDAEKGTKIWEQPIELPAFAPPILAGEHVYYGVGNGNFDSSHDRPQGALICVDAKTGKRIWQADARDAVLSLPAVDADFAYFTSRDGHVYCVNRTDGKTKWKRSLGAPIVASPTLSEMGASRNLYVASTEGRLECLNLADGEPYWSLELNQITRTPKAGVFATPTVEIRHDGNSNRRRIYIAAHLTGRLNSSTFARWICFED